MIKIENSALDQTVDKINFKDSLEYFSGKVRETFLLKDNKRAIVVSDRISAFDFILGTVPYKGQVLNKIAAWWFRELDKIEIPHHLISVPHPNISLVKNVKPLPIEIIVRGYLTGSTTTSSWYAYQNNNQEICGLKMTDGMKKNEKFPKNIVTPTTKPEVGHDRNISKEEILEEGLVDSETYEKVEAYALKMFEHGQKKAAERGLILVDTKYEMGLTVDGELIVIDEVHTPDSSRYWIEETYAERLKSGQEPQSLDKEFVRIMLVEAGYDVDNKDQDPKDFMTDSIRLKAAEKYIALYEKMTDESFKINKDESGAGSIENCLKEL